MVVVIVDDEASRHRELRRLEIFKDKDITFYDCFSPKEFLSLYREGYFGAIDILFLDNDMGVLEDGVWLAKELVKYYTLASPIAQIVVHSMNVVAAEVIVDIINDSHIIGEAYVIRIPANTLIAEY